MKKLLLILTILFAMVNYAKADNFVTDVMVIGGTQAETNNLKTYYQNLGWTVVNQDLNAGVSGDYIYLLYKTDSDANPDASFITYFNCGSFYNEEGLMFGAVLNQEGIMISPAGHYVPVPYAGGSNFTASHGNLNSGTTNGNPLYLYYTKESNGGTDNPHLVKSITFNSTSTGAMPVDDLNLGCEGNAPEIYMHPDITQGWVFWQGSDTECIISAYDGPKAWITEYTVPSTHDGLYVIAADVFSGFINLETLIFPNNSHVTQMPRMQGCTNFKHVNIRLNNNVFQDRTPPSMTSIPDNAFYGTAIEELTMPSVTQVGDYAFEGCNLSSVTFNQSNVQIGSRAFANISRNCTVTYSGSVDDWSPNAYVYSPNLFVNASDGSCGWCGGAGGTSENYLYWTLDNATGHLYIDWLWQGSPEQQVISSHNWNKNNVHSLTLNHVYIRSEEFKSYTSLTTVTIGDGVTGIGNSAFKNCTSLTTITIPNSVTSIGNSAFYGCTGLTSVHISDLAAWCNISFDNHWANPLDYAHHLYLNDNEITDLVIPNSVTSIKNHAFYECTGLTSVNTPNSVTSIGESAFDGCSGLTSVNIPNSVTSIGNNVFHGCSGLASVNIPNSVTSIGNNAFDGCSGLASVNIPNSVTSIGESAFSHCSGLTSVNIPNSVTSIGGLTFYFCSSLKDLYFDGTKAQWNTVTKGNQWNYNVSSNYKEHWRCTVTFNANGHGTAPAPQTNLWSNESMVTQPTAPTASGYAFTGWYTDAQCTTPWNFGTDVVPDDMTLYAGWDLEVEGLQGSGTDEDPYLISNNGEWIWFAQSVTNDTTYANKFLKLTADIAVTEMVGLYRTFSGTLDGDGHTITLALSGGGQGTALFYLISGATLKNLKVQGTVTTTGYRPATFAAIVNGNSTISNCWSTVALSSTRANDWVDGGGFVGRVSNGATLNMTDCAFHGSVTFTPSATTGGGMVGYTQSNATVNLTNCLYSPSALSLSVNAYNPRIFVCGYVEGNLVNCYYNDVAAASVLENQGTDASGMSNEALVAALGPNWTITDGLVVPKWILTFTKAIAGYGTGSGGWHLIASPVGTINPQNVTNMLIGNYDLYAFEPNPSDSLEWRNYKADTFSLEAGKGYLYAHNDTVTLVFTGAPIAATDSVEVPLVYDSTNDRKCWNLVGNPFLTAAYLDRPYYVLDADGMDINPEPIPASVPVPVCTAVFVKATEEGDTVVFGTQQRRSARY
ncbi:MAG: leucine-rich repeat protein [Muribaculaceae bacterium]|nr:leucine-rich repeat protein [Muribaculaceae bacterium]